MDPYLTDEERWQQVKDWWKKNGTMLIVGVVIGLVIVYQWRNYQTNKSHKMTSAAISYNVLRGLMYRRALSFAAKKADADKADEAVVAKAKDIIKNYESTPYSVDASLLLAKVYVEKNNLKSAQTYLEWALQKLSEDNYKYYVVKMRLARVLRDKGEYDSALSQLKIQPPEPMKKYFDFIKGTAHEGKKECAIARENYQKSIDQINKELKADKENQAQQQELKTLVEQRLENVSNC